MRQHTEVWLFRYLDGDNPQLEGAENGQFILNLLPWLSAHALRPVLPPAGTLARIVSARSL